jgi:hypothetical protein
MKVIITEEQIRKFNRESATQGKFSKALEQLTISFIGKENICDLVAVTTDEKNYVVLVLFNGPSSYNLSSKLDVFLKQFLPIKVFSLITDTECNN